MPRRLPKTVGKNLSEQTNKYMVSIPFLSPFIHIKNISVILCWVGTSTSQMEQRINFKFEEIIRWWRFANTTDVWGALSRGFGGQEFLGFHLKISKDMAVNLDQRKAHFSTHVSAAESTFTFSKTHLPPSPSFPDVFPALPQGAALWTHLAGFACRLLRGRRCQLLQLFLLWNQRELPHKAPCWGWDVCASRLVNCVPFQSWVKAWLSPPSGPCEISNSFPLSWQPYHPTN